MERDHDARPEDATPVLEPAEAAFEAEGAEMAKRRISGSMSMAMKARSTCCWSLPVARRLT